MAEEKETRIFWPRYGRVNSDVALEIQQEEIPNCIQSFTDFSNKQNASWHSHASSSCMQSITDLSRLARKKVLVQESQGLTLRKAKRVITKKGRLNNNNSNDDCLSQALSERVSLTQKNHYFPIPASEVKDDEPLLNWYTTKKIDRYGRFLK